MCADFNKIGFLKEQLRSETKFKLSKEKELIALRNTERAMNDQLTNVKLLKELLHDQIEELKKEVVQARHQISMIDICSVSENMKIKAHIHNITAHRQSFQDLFDKDQKEKEAEVEELVRQNDAEAAEKYELQVTEIAAVEAENEAIEQECLVLQKRNNAIMLKLRRKLLDSENLRRKLMKRYEDDTPGATFHNRTKDF